MGIPSISINMMGLREPKAHLKESNVFSSKTFLFCLYSGGLLSALFIPLFVYDFSVKPSTTNITSVPSPASPLWANTSLPSPCTDFYEHACTATIKRLESMELNSMLMEARESNRALLLSALSSGQARNFSHSRAVSFFVDLLAKCQAERSSLQRRRVFRELKEAFKLLVGGASHCHSPFAPKKSTFKCAQSDGSPKEGKDLPDKLSQWASLLSAYYCLTGAGVIVDITQDVDVSKPREKRLCLQLSGTALPQEYHFFAQLNDAFETDNSVWQEIMDLEGRLEDYQISLSVEDAFKQPNLTLGSLSRLMEPAVSFNWTQQMNDILEQCAPSTSSNRPLRLFAETEPVYATVFALQSTLGVIEETPIRVLRNYVTFAYLLYLRDTVPGGGNAPSCLSEGRDLSQIERSFSAVLSRVYIEATMAASSPQYVRNLQENTQTMVEKVREAISRLFASSDTPNQETPQSMSNQIAFDSWLLNDTALDTWYGLTEPGLPELTFNHSATFMENYQAWNRATIAGKLTRTGAFSDDRWDDSVERIVCQARILSRQVVLSLGFLFPPILQRNTSPAGAYGGIGSLIAHELVHLLNLSENPSFREVTQCLMEQYSAIREPQTGLYLRGTQTIEEDIADNGAIKASFAAYRSATREHITPETDQQFFYSFAQEFCANFPPETMEEIIESSDHSVYKYRVNVVLSNFDQFSRTFSCPLGSPMNPAKKCTVW